MSKHTVLVVYTEGNKRDLQNLYGKDAVKYLNISRRPLSDIQGCRFESIVFHNRNINRVIFDKYLLR